MAAIPGRVSWGFIDSNDYSQGWFIRFDSLECGAWAAKYFDVPEGAKTIYQGSDEDTVQLLVDNIGEIEDKIRLEKIVFEGDLAEIKSMTIADFA
jgi:hypothetical protein